MSKYNYKRTDLWVCTGCGDTFGRHDQWFEGNKCECCIDNPPQKKKKIKKN